MPALLSDEQVAERLTAGQPLSPPGVPAHGPVAAPSSRYFEPSIEAVHSYSQYLTSEGSFQTGFRAIDLCMPGGLDRGDMLLLIGKTHSGKSTAAYCMVAHNLRRNPDWRAVIFSPDEPRELCIAKLFSIGFGRDSADTEKAIREGDQRLIDEFHSAARGMLDRVLICDQSLTFSQMLSAMTEAKEYWGAPADGVVMDYLELLPGDAADNTAVAHKAQSAKRFAKVADVPLVLLHQIGRGAAPRGKPAGISGGRFGGESEAVAVLEVYRPKDREDLSVAEKERVEDVVRISLVKNKRPPFRLIDVEMILDPRSGRIVEPDVFDMQHRDWQDEF